MGRHGLVPTDSFDKELAKVEPKRPWLKPWGWIIGLLPPVFLGLSGYHLLRALIFRKKEEKVAFRFRKNMRFAIRDYPDFRRVMLLQMLVYLGWGALTTFNVFHILFLATWIFFVPSPGATKKLLKAKASERKMIEGGGDD